MTQSFPHTTKCSQILKNILHSVNAEAVPREPSYGVFVYSCTFNTVISVHSPQPLVKNFISSVRIKMRKHIIH